MEVGAISTALEREAPNWVRLAALIMIVTKQLKEQGEEMRKSFEEEAASGRSGTRSGLSGTSYSVGVDTSSV